VHIGGTVDSGLSRLYWKGGAGANANCQVAVKKRSTWQDGWLDLLGRVLVLRLSKRGPIMPTETEKATMARSWWSADSWPATISLIIGMCKCVPLALITPSLLGMKTPNVELPSPVHVCLAPFGILAFLDWVAGYLNIPFALAAIGLGVLGLTLVKQHQGRVWLLAGLSWAF